MGIYDRDWWRDQGGKRRRESEQRDRGFGPAAFGWLVAALVVSSFVVLAYRL